MSQHVQESALMTIRIDDFLYEKEFNCEINGEYYERIPESRLEPYEPEEPECVVITSITADGDDIMSLFSDQEIESLEEMMLGNFK